MNILYTNFHKDIGGGHTTYIQNLLRNGSHTKFVACPGGSKLFTDLKNSGFNRLFALDFPSRITEIGATWSNALKLKRIIEENSIDIVHTNGSADNRLALFASWFCKKKFKVVFTKHNTYKIKGFISKLRLTRFNDAVILVGPHVAEKAEMGKNSKFFVVEHGVDLDYWKRETPPEIPGNIIRLVSNSGTSRHKGWQHMAEAVQSLPEEKKARLSVTVIGRDMSWHNGVASKECVNFPGFQQDPRPFLENADIGFVLSYHEASSYAAREMMSMSLPVILSDFAGHEPAYASSCGWVTKVGDAESVKRVLLKILDMEPEELKAMKLAARAKAKADFSLERSIEKTNEVYARIMNQ